MAVGCLRLSISDPELIHEVNATGTLNLCQSALENGVERFVYVSSSEAYGSAQKVPMSEDHPLEPTTPYGASKAAGELYAKSFYYTYNLPIIIVRPFNTYGPREHFEGPYGEVIPRFVIRAMNDLPPIIFGDGEQTRDFTYVSDTVNGIILASQQESLIGDCINIAYGQEIKIKRIAEIVLNLLGKAELRPEHTKRRPGDVLRHYADISKAKTLLGFEPKIGIEEGIKEYIEWIANRNIDPREYLKKHEIFNW